MEERGRWPEGLAGGRGNFGTSLSPPPLLFRSSQKGESLAQANKVLFLRKSRVLLLPVGAEEIKGHKSLTKIKGKFYALSLSLSYLAGIKVSLIKSTLSINE